MASEWAPVLDKDTGEPKRGQWLDSNGYTVVKSEDGEINLFAPGQNTPIHTTMDRLDVPFFIVEHMLASQDFEALKGISKPTGMSLNDFHPDTPEQAQVTNYKGSKLVVIAFAGTGKTTTLIKYAIKNPTLRILYIAYNRAIADESKTKFPNNVTCMTAHSLAYHSIGREYRKKLKNNLQLNDIIDLFKLSRGTDGVYDLAAEIMFGLNTFMSSADKKPEIWHLEEFGEKVGFSPYWLEKANNMVCLISEVWRSMCDQETTFPMTHDGYLKLYHVSQPDLAMRFGAILLDEAQDTTPVVASLVLEQDLATILVGDEHQQIYKWRGASNSLNSDYTKGADRLYLTNSFRFGPRVAMVANALLAYKGETKKVIGRGGSDEVLFKLPDDFKGQVCYLSRTVMGVIESAARAAAQQKKVFWIGGKSAYQIGDAMDVYHLSTGEKAKVKNKKISSEFRSFEQYKAAAVTTKDPEMNRAARMVSTFGDNLPALLRRLDSLTVDDIDDADVIVCTAHRSKGLEFETVVLNEDFPYLFDKFYDDKPEVMDDEVNLLYVAVTRALKSLIINTIVEAFIRARVINENNKIKLI